MLENIFLIANIILDIALLYCILTLKKERTKKGEEEND